MRRVVSYLAGACWALMICGAADVAAAPLSRPSRPGERPTAARPSAAPRASVAEPSGVAAAATKRPAATKRNKAAETIDVAVFAKQHGLTLQWLEPGKRFQLTGTGPRVEFEVGSREFSIDGARAFLGEAIRMPQKKALISRIDAERFVGPILRPSAAGPAPALRVIALDAGHGGRDSGKVNPRLKVSEKTLTLDMVNRMKPLLEKQGYRVVLTRTEDRFVELAERAEIADRAGADLFISVHFNSVESGAERVTGVEVFTMTPQHQLSTDQNPDSQASKANPGNLYDGWNAVLGHCLHKAMLDDMKVPDRGLKHGRLAVLRLSSCPAALVEAGYLSHPDETRKLMKPAYRQQIAEALADGVSNYARALESARKKR